VSKSNQCLQRYTSLAILLAKQILPKWSVKNNNTMQCRMTYSFVLQLITLELHVRRDPHYFNLNSIPP
jgi:hypothetical protein